VNAPPRRAAWQWRPPGDYYSPVQASKSGGGAINPSTARQVGTPFIQYCSYPTDQYITLIDQMVPGYGQS
jgi:hypothetical protein